MDCSAPINTRTVHPSLGRPTRSPQTSSAATGTKGFIPLLYGLPLRKPATPPTTHMTRALAALRPTPGQPSFNHLSALTVLINCTASPAAVSMPNIPCALLPLLFSEKTTSTGKPAPPQHSALYPQPARTFICESFSYSASGAYATRALSSALPQTGRTTAPTLPSWISA